MQTAQILKLLPRLQRLTESGTRELAMLQGSSETDAKNDSTRLESTESILLQADTSHGVSRYGANQLLHVSSLSFYKPWQLWETDIFGRLFYLALFPSFRAEFTASDEKC